MAKSKPLPTSRQQTNGFFDPASLSGLGERLREARVERGLSLRELARRLEVSPSLLSQIETGKTHPSVRTLYAIVDALGVLVHELFPAKDEGGEAASSGASQPTPERGTAAAPPPATAGAADAGSTRALVQRAGERAAIDLESGVRWERLTPWNDREVEFNYSIYRAGSESSHPGSLMRHSGREFGVVISGELRVTVGFEEFVLRPGDSIAFESSVPHRLYNEGDEDVHAIWMVLGRYQGFSRDQDFGPGSH
jgi:transcriptional regulator with XRE-family HTH domain